MFKVAKARLGYVYGIKCIECNPIVTQGTSVFSHLKAFLQTLFYILQHTITILTSRVFIGTKSMFVLQEKELFFQTNKYNALSLNSKTESHVLCWDMRSKVKFLAKTKVSHLCISFQINGLYCEAE